jgi:NADH:ubiquinone oxidoreductase subunit 5 (subunit L)/multisubunit Na+/H+ antiporter MnhA subunit
VCFLNKFYFDEVYSVLIVQPITAFCKWLCREVDVRRIDGFTRRLATTTIGVARWVWHVVDVTSASGLMNLATVNSGI